MERQVDLLEACSVFVPISVTQPRSVKLPPVPSVITLRLQFPCPPPLYTQKCSPTLI